MRLFSRFFLPLYYIYVKTRKTHDDAISLNLYIENINKSLPSTNVKHNRQISALIIFYLFANVLRFKRIAYHYRGTWSCRFFGISKN